MISKIRDKVSNQRTDNKKAFISSVLRIMREFPAYKWDDVLALPIPVYICMVENIIEADRIKAEQKKHGK